MDEVALVKRFIIESLLTPPRWGGKHTELRNVVKGVPSNLSQSKVGQKAIEKALKELTNSGWLFCKKSTGEIHVSLNLRMKKEIMEFIIGS